MTFEDELGKLERLLIERAELQKQAIDIDVQLKIQEMRLSCFATSGVSVGESVAGRERTSFLEAWADQLDEDDRRFLSKPFRATSETAEYLRTSAATVKRKGGAGLLSSRKNPTGGLEWCTMSAVRYLLDENAIKD